MPLAEFEDLPISQAALAEMADGNDYVNIPLTNISWYHHISMRPKIKMDAERALYILETTRNWSRDVMVSKINSGYMDAVGNAISFSTGLLMTALLSSTATSVDAMRLLAVG